MKFEPKTEEQANAGTVCPDGKQPFTVLEASEVKSQSVKNAGKDMLKLKLNVHADDGYDYHVYDYIAPWFRAWKFRHFFFAVECSGDYETGVIDAPHLVGRQGIAELKQETPTEGKYAGVTKAVVNDYVTADAKTKPAVAPDGAVAAAEDDVPF